MAKSTGSRAGIGGRNRQESCARGHDLSISRCYRPNGATYCGACEVERLPKRRVEAAKRRKRSSGVRAGVGGSRTAEQIAAGVCKKGHAWDPSWRRCGECSRINSREWKARNVDKVLDSNLRQYGLAASDYHRLFEKQGGLCAICKRRAPGKHRLHVDHDHKTGVIRGLLCSGCNTGLGAFNEEVKSAIEYLDSDFQKAMVQMMEVGL